MSRDCYAMYLRKSRADEEAEALGQYETLSKHHADLTELCSRSGYLVAKVYKELASGESVAARPEFRALMEEVAQRKYKGIIVHATDRLGRGDPMEYGWILSTLKYTHTLIITMGRTYDPSDPSDMQLLQIQMFVSQYELENTKRRLREGRERKVKDGCHIASRAPFGYDKHVNAFKQKTLAANGDAPTVKAIYEQVAAGATPNQLSTRLNSRLVPSPRGGKWMPSMIEALVSNPVYKGYVRWNHYTTQAVTRNGMDVVKRRVRNDKPILEKGLHDPIVTEELWQAANANLRPSPKTRKDYTLANPLAGLLVCAKCGHAMVYHQTITGGRTYRRIEHYRYCDCKTRSTNAENVVNLVAESLTELASDVECEVAFESEAARIQEEKEALKKSMAAERRKIDRLIELYAAEAITMSEFVERKNPSTALVENLAEKLSELEAYAPRDKEEVRLNIKDALRSLNDPNASAETINTALKRFIDRIEYRNNTTDKKNQQISLQIFLK